MAPLETYAEDSPTIKLNQFGDDYRQLDRSNFANGKKTDVDALDKIFNQYFGAYLTSGSVQELDSTVLPALHRALRTMVYRSRGDRYTQKLIEVTYEIYRRHITPHDSAAKHNYAQDTYDNLVEIRHFDEAGRLHAAFPRLISAFSYGRIDAPDASGNRPAIVVPDEVGKTLEVRPVAVDKGRWFVAVVHTGCPFSLQAMAYIENHLKEVVPLLPDNTIWVAGQGFTKIIPALEKWNQSSRLIKIHVAYQDNAWPQGLWMDATPGFYVLEDGVVVDKVDGWPSDEQAAKLMAMLRKFKNG